MNTNSILTSKKEMIKFSDTRAMVPSTIYESSLHDQVCLYIAKRKIFDTNSDEFKLYVNLLLLKSKKVKELTSLIFLINRDMLDVQEIRCNYVERAFFDDFIKSKNNIKYVVNFKEYNLIDTKYKYIIFPVKMIWHKIYRLLKSKFEYKKSLIKTFVEDTLSFYPDQMQNSTIFIYPFNLNFNRQKKFIEYCKKNHKNNYSLMGYPYSLFGYLLGLITKNRDINIINAEKKAFLSHSIELIKLNIKEFYTLDEFETSSFIMNGYLIRNNVFVLNKTHGVGGYCVYLNYSELEVFTSKQYERYKQFNPNIKIAFQKLNIPNSKKYKNTNVKLIFMLSNFGDHRLKYDEELQKRIAIKLQEISLRLNLEYFIKLHPNSKEKTKKDYRSLNIQEIYDVQQVANPLFVTISSTSFYDFLKLGPFVFLSDNVLDPTFAFGKDIIQYYDYDEAEEIIKHSIVYDNYKALHKRQIENLNNR